MTVWGRVTMAGAMMLGGMGVATTAWADTSGNPEEQVYAGPLLGYDNVAISEVGASTNRGGLTYGGRVGVDSPVGPHGRVGLEAEFSGSTAAWTFSGGGDVIKLSAGRDLYLGAKFGWMVSPRVQAFATAGYTNMRLNASLTENGVKTAEGGMNMNGYRIGAGAEYTLSRQARLRLEYRYSNYGHLSVDGVATPLKVERQQIVAGVLYGF